MSKQYDYDIKFHSERADLYRRLQVAVREYLTHNVVQMPPAAIASLAGELKDFSDYEQREEKRVEEYRILQAQELEAIEAEVISETTMEVTQL